MPCLRACGDNVGTTFGESEMNQLVREFDMVVISGTDGHGLFHDELIGTIGTVSHDCIKVWPHDILAGDGSGKLWFSDDDIRKLDLIVLEDDR